jgi:hypothetical protein
VINNEILLELFNRYVRFDGETVTDVKTWPDSLGVVVATEGRLLSVRSDSDFLQLGREPWVDALVVVEREDVLSHGQHETDAIVIGTDARGHHLNDPTAVAELGQRVGTDIDPAAFAEVLVAYHPWSVARRELVRSADQLSTRLGITAGPEVGPPAEVPANNALALAFFSTAVYAPMLGAPLRCDVYQWRVDIPRGGNAVWGRRLVAEKLPVPLPARPSAAG